MILRLKLRNRLRDLEIKRKANIIECENLDINPEEISHLYRVNFEINIRINEIKNLLS